MTSETATNALPTPLPAIDPDTREFWAATNEGHLLVPVCNACSEASWPPRALCPHCHSDDVSMTRATGRGTVYSYTEVAKGLGDYATAGPYVLAYVELDEGVRLMTNIVERNTQPLAVGDAVEVVFERAGEDAALPRFRPVRTEGSPE